MTLDDFIFLIHSVKFKTLQNYENFSFYFQFERKKKEFIEKLKELEKTQLRLQGLQKKWEEAVE